MANRRADYPLERVSFFLFEGEFAKLRSFYPKLGASAVIRELVHRHVRAIEEKAQQSYSRLDVDLVKEAEQIIEEL